MPAEPAFSLLFRPHPPVPLPGGKGETFYFISPGAGAPGTPAAEPGRHGLFLWKAVPQGGLVPGVAGWLCCAGARGGLACFVACLPCHLFTVFPPSPRPRSQSALPSGKGENQGYFMQGASPLASPALNRLRHLQTLPFRYPGASLPWNRARACVHENNREKFLGVWGLLSRRPQRFPVL